MDAVYFSCIKSRDSNSIILNNFIYFKTYLHYFNTGQVKSPSGVSWACRTVTMADMAKTLVLEERAFFQVFIDNKLLTMRNL